MRNAIYSCFSHTTPFTKSHIISVKQYCKRHNLTDIIICTDRYHIDKFTKYDAYDHFFKSKFDNMIYIDWDVLIQNNAENIFDAYPECCFGAYYLPDHPDADYKNDYDNFKSLISVDKDFELSEYFNSGVILLNHETIDGIFPIMRDTYDRILEKTKDIAIESIRPYAREEFLLNYIIETTETDRVKLDKKWNTAFEDGLDYTDDGWFLHFNKPTCRDKTDTIRSIIGRKALLSSE